MSVITEVILTCLEPDYNDLTRRDLPVRWINSRIIDHVGCLVRIDNRVTKGSKFLIHDIWAAAFNKLDKAKFLQSVKDAPWDSPEYVTLMWSEEEDDGFVIAWQGREKEFSD